jgi:hypothetical protein
MRWRSLLRHYATSRTVVDSSPDEIIEFNGQCSWLQIQRSGFDFRLYQISWEVVGLEREPLSLVSTIEELLGGKSSGSGLESRENGHRDPSRWPRGTLYPQNLALTSPTSGGRSVGIVRSRTQATEFSLVFLPNPFSRTIALTFTRPLIEMSTRKYFRGVERYRRVRLTNSPPLMSQLSRKYVILDISESYRPPKPVTGIALLLLT